MPNYLTNMTRQLWTPLAAHNKSPQFLQLLHLVHAFSPLKLSLSFYESGLIRCETLDHRSWSSSISISEITGGHADEEETCCICNAITPSEAQSYTIH